MNFFDPKRLVHYLVKAGGVYAVLLKQLEDVQSALLGYLSRPIGGLMMLFLL